MIRTILVTAAISVLAVVLRVSGSWTDHETKPSMSYRIAPQFSEHQPVVLEVIYDNPSDVPLELHLGRNRLGRLHFVLRSPDGQLTAAEPGALTGAGGLSSRGDGSVGPGQRLTDRVLLNKWLQFEQIGAYSLQVRFDGIVRQADQDVPVQRDVSIPIQIVARDQAMLLDTCAHLLNIVRVNVSYEASSDAAEELSYVTDPIAIPYLVKAVESDHYVDNIAIDGLERIGTYEARLALEHLLVNPRLDTVRWARDALTRLDARRQ